MAVRVVVCCFLGALVLSGGGIASAAPHYSDWSNIAPFSAVNTSALEFANAISKDGLTFYFQRGDASVNGEDIWVAQRDREGAVWGAPLKLPTTVNSGFNDRAAFESPDGHWLYFASDRPGGKGGFDLYVSWRQHTHDDTGWQSPTRLEVLNTAGFDSGPTLFEDELAGALHMYFVSNPAGPQNAAVDIYESLQNPDGSFATASKVPALNSDANEGRPYVRHDGLEIFFNSARAGGPGPADIWVSTRESTADTWTTPQLAQGVNTAAVDNTPALSWDARTLYFGSVRTGNADIFTATREKVTGKP